MREDFRGKVAFIAGASGGINFAIARELSRLGARVGLVSRNAERIGAAAASLVTDGGQAIGIAADVRDYERVEKAALQTKDAFGPIDIVVSGAAGNFLAFASEMSANAFRTVVDIDLIGTFNVFRATLNFLQKPGASLISISAPQGTRPFVQQAHACAAKAGVNMLTRALALEWAPHGVRVNGISPGPISGTEGVKRLWPDDEVESRIISEVPLGRLGALDDISKAVVYLSSAAARYVTGTILDVDGGYLWKAAASSMSGAA